MRKLVLFPVAVCILLWIPACETKPACPPRAETERFLMLPDLEALSTPASDKPSSPLEVKISGRNTLVDQVVSGQLCNDSWKGTIYVTCDVQVLEWEDDPLFLKDCDLSIEPGTIVYVAYHNDAPYYNGCSCHTGGTP